MEKFEVSDRSSDRKYFTQIPNMIFDTLSGEAQLLYCLMKRLGGEGGEAYAGNSYYTQKTKWGLKKIKAAQKELVAIGYISDRGLLPRQTHGGVQYVHVFELRDVWKANVITCGKRGCQKRIPSDKGGVKSSQRGCQEESKGVSKDTYKKIDSTNIINKRENLKNEDEKTKIQKLEKIKNELIAKGAISEIGLSLARDKKRIAREEELEKIDKKKITAII